MENTIEPETQTNWWTWFGLILIVLLIIIGVIVAYTFNKNNQLNILASIPSYNVYYPKTQSYLNIINALPSPLQTTLPLTQNGNNMTPSNFWSPNLSPGELSGVRVKTTKNLIGMPIWKFEALDSTSFDGDLGTNTPIYIVNAIYNTQSQTVGASNFGYLYTNGLPPNMIFSPESTIVGAAVFIYTPINNNNQFNLSLRTNNPNDTNNKIDIDDNGFMVLGTTSGIFQLVLLPSNN